MNNTRRHKVLQPESHWWHRLKISTQKFGIGLSLLAVALGFTYVWMTNSTAATGFAIEKLQGELKTMRDQNERLELTAADLRALSVVQTTSTQLGLEPTDQFDVLPAGGAVAVQR
jgi:hypothetical protein